jgi:hypothetical protein
VRTAYDDGDPCRPQGISHAVGLGDHSGHGTDANQPDPLATHESHQFLFIHRTRVPVDQQDLMAGRRQRLQEKHPQMRHKTTRHAIIRIIEQNPHSPFLLQLDSQS